MRPGQCTASRDHGHGRRHGKTTPEAAPVETGGPVKQRSQRPVRRAFVPASRIGALCFQPGHLRCRHRAQEAWQASQPGQFLPAVSAPGEMAADGTAVGRADSADEIDTQRVADLAALPGAGHGPRRRGPLRSPLSSVSRIVLITLTTSRPALTVHQARRHCSSRTCSAGRAAPTRYRLNRGWATSCARVHAGRGCFRRWPGRRSAALRCPRAPGRRRPP